jgi:hypothetical protein
MKEAQGDLQFGFWVAVLFGRKFELDNERGITFSLLGEAEKGGRQIFKLDPYGWVVIGFRSSKKLKGLRPIIIPRRHSRLPMSFYTLPTVQCSAV